MGESLITTDKTYKMRVGKEQMRQPQEWFGYSQANFGRYVCISEVVFTMKRNGYRAESAVRKIDLVTTQNDR